jgi:hypothetical protein
MKKPTQPMQPTQLKARSTRSLDAATLAEIRGGQHGFFDDIVVKPDNFINF